MNKIDEKSDVSKSYEDYMARVKREFIPCYEPSIGTEEIDVLADVIKSNWLSENKYTREFERQLANACHRKYASCFCNATSSLITGMKSGGIGYGDDIIVPSFSHPADPNSIAATGANPVFADIDQDTLCLSVKTIKEAKTQKTKAVMLVSAYGNAADLDKIQAYCNEESLMLINDCAPALFGTYKGNPIPSYGDFSVLSFFADKTITTGEGGMLLTDNLDLINKSNIYKHDGRKERGVDIIEKRGYNFRITELQAAVGVAQLKKAPFFVKRKKEILKTFQKKLSDLDNVEVFSFNPNADVVPHRVLLFAQRASKLIEHLNSFGIGVRTTFMPMHSQPCYAVNKKFPVTEKIYNEGVCLPSAPTLTDESIDYICKSIRKFYEQ